MGCLGFPLKPGPFLYLGEGGGFNFHQYFPVYEICCMEWVRLYHLPPSHQILPTTLENGYLVETCLSNRPREEANRRRLEFHFRSSQSLPRADAFLFPVRM